MIVESREKYLQTATLSMVLLNAFTTPLMLSAANVALPAIARDLQLNAVFLSWVPMAYLMASAMFVLAFGRVADMVGRKRVFITGTVCVIVTSFLAFFATNGYWLIGARFLQGISAAMLYATQIAIISSVFPPAKRGQMIGMTIAMIYLGLSFGPVAGGFLIDVAGWRYSFIFHIPLAVIVLLIAVLFVKTEWQAEEPGKFDLKGAALYSITIITLCTGVSLLPAAWSWLLITTGLCGLILFVHFARKTEHPVFDVRLFYSNRVFAMSSLASFILYTATFANVVLIGLYLQYIRGMSASAAGLIMMIQPLTMAALSPIAGKISDHMEPRLIATFGMLVTFTGLILLVFLDGASSQIYLVAALITTGTGFSLFSSPNTNAIMGSVEKRYYGSASGSIATMRTLGQMSSMVLVTLVFALVIGQVEIQPENFADLQKAIQVCFSLAALLCLPGMVFSFSRGTVHR